MLAGYMRVSSLDLNPERQLEELSALWVMKIFMGIIRRRTIGISRSTAYRYIPINEPKKN